MKPKSQPKTNRTPEKREQDLIFIAPLLVDGVPIWRITEMINEARDYPDRKSVV